MRPSDHAVANYVWFRLKPGWEIYTQLTLDLAKTILNFEMLHSFFSVNVYFGIFPKIIRISIE